MEVERISCAPHLVVREVVQVLAANAQAKDITLTFEADGPIPEAIQSDPSRLRQIVTNLVGNAIKFTKTGGVKIVLSLVAGPNPKLCIDVADSGIGMTQQQMDRIFDPFSQADSSVTRRFGGTGLGLTISRRFAEALGGEITVSSEPGKGSVFSVTIDTGPLDGIEMVQPDALDTADQHQEAQLTSWKFNSERVLVVDDARENRELLEVVLGEAGLTVECAENGKVGSDMALANEYDVILMDMQMPVMDGYAATRLLREQGLSTPLYALTANAMKGFEKECLEVGASGFLTKPIDIDLLLETLGNLLGVKQVTAPTSNDVIRAAAAVAATVSEGAPIVSTLPLNVPRFAAVIRTFHQRLEEELAEMNTALGANDFAHLANRAHWLKGSGGSVGFPAFTDPATRLEIQAQEESPEDITLTLLEIEQLWRRIQLPPDSSPPAVTATTESTHHDPAPHGATAAVSGNQPIQNY